MWGGENKLKDIEDNQDKSRCKGPISFMDLTFVTAYVCKLTLLIHFFNFNFRLIIFCGHEIWSACKAVKNPLMKILHFGKIKR